MGYNDKFGPYISLLSLVLTFAYVEYSLCQIWSGYMQYLRFCDHSNKCLFLVIQLAEVLLNFLVSVFLLTYGCLGAHKCIPKPISKSMEIRFTLTSILTQRPLHSFVHDTAAVLSWHVQNFVVIWWPGMKLQQGEISIEFDLRAKVVNERASELDHHCFGPWPIGIAEQRQAIITCFN